MRPAICFLMILGVGCASGHCRKAQVPAGVATIPAPNAKGSDVKEGKKVLVYRYDGSLQCNQGIPTTLEKMKEDLKDIKVFSMEKRNDGQMRIQVCGTNTGTANVYEIDEKDLNEALKLGFELWKF